MKKIQTMTLTAFTVFTLGALASAAFGASEWLTNGAAITSARVVKTKWVMKFSDSKGGIFGEKVEIECFGTDEGTSGPGTSGKITKWTVTSCKEITVSICPADATAVHMPWNTKLVLVGEKWRDDIENSGAGAPGWNITCPGLIEDECTGETSTEPRNVTGGVESVFDGKSAKLNCSRGGTGAGAVLGTDLNENPSGEFLTVS